ncbi:MAG TPA: cyclic pyranopterin monophosphate synthase MoaC [Clostridiaceae bacterium]|nr:cyclic pyranopterin monophosphate synthase MoaC [Clostridiaceae bacterium]
MFTHLDKNKRGQMVDVSQKKVTERAALARGMIRLQPETIQAIQDVALKKGDVLAIAQVAAIQGAKNTPRIIPLAHPLLLTKINVDFHFTSEHLICNVEVKAEGKTGVEMEALTGCASGLLTIYDMCKAMDKSMCIEKIFLVKKTGGQSGDYEYKGTDH